MKHIKLFEGFVNSQMPNLVINKYGKNDLGSLIAKAKDFDFPMLSNLRVAETYLGKGDITTIENGSDLYIYQPAVDNVRPITSPSNKRMTISDFCAEVGCDENGILAKLGAGSASDRFIWMGYSDKADGYCAGVVTEEEAKNLQSLFKGEISPLADNAYVYIDLEQAEMRPEKQNFDIEGLSFVSTDGEDNYFDDEEPDYDKIVIELPSEGITVLSPDQNGWNAKIMSVSEFIQKETNGR